MGNIPPGPTGPLLPTDRTLVSLLSKRTPQKHSQKRQKTWKMFDSFWVRVAIFHFQIVLISKATGLHSLADVIAMIAEAE